MSRTRQVPSPAASGSQVLQDPENQSTVQSSGTLRLRGENNVAPPGISNTGRHIRWSNDVVDNEGMGKKSSKGKWAAPPKKKLLIVCHHISHWLLYIVCCIYHKPRPVGESSSESESSDSSESDTDSEPDRDQTSPSSSHRALRQSGQSSNENTPEENFERGHATCCAKHHGKKDKRRKPSPNAYEKMPKSARGHSKPQGS